MNEEIFEQGSVSKAYFTFSIPLVTGFIITMLYNIADTYFIARTQDVNLIAGVSLCAPVFTLLARCTAGTGGFASDTGRLCQLIDQLFDQCISKIGDRYTAHDHKHYFQNLHDVHSCCPFSSNLPESIHRQIHSKIMATVIFRQIAA